MRGLERRFEVGALLATLFLIFGLITAFVIFLVQVQGAATAYMAGQSQWSRAQLGSVFSLYRYLSHGNPDDLSGARELLDIPLGDMRARRAMDAEELDRQAAADGLLRGENYPDDIPGMIWLYRNFSNFPYLRDAADVWRESDEYILALVDLADRIEQAWHEGPPPAREYAMLLAELELINARNYELTTRFLQAFTDAGRALRQTLTLGSVFVITLFALMAALVGWRLILLIDQSRRRFQSIFEHAAVGMAEVDQRGHLINANTAMADILGYSRQELRGKSYQSLTLEEDVDIGLEQGRALLRGEEEAVTVEQRFRHKDGGIVWGRLTVSTINGKRGLPESMIAILEDVSESRRLSVELQYQAAHDALTDLINRRGFDRELAKALRTVRESHVVHSVCFIDMDQFKVVNDTCGHAAGDHMLIQVADLLKENLREGDVLARLGGDEFGLLLRNCDLNAATHVAEKLCHAMEALVFEWEGQTFSASCSIGVVPVERDMADINVILRSADLACYIAKEKGRNRVHVSNAQDEQLRHRRGQMEWVNRIRQALDDNRFFLEAQYIQALQTDEPVRYEVLLRMRDEHGESVPPGAFIPAAERFDIAYRLDRWVLEQVCRTLADHPQHRASLGACHVNLSGQSFDRPDFQQLVLDTLDYYGVPASSLCFEITETAAIRRIADATEFMAALSRKGCQFALDDFGAGLSSFAYLRRLPVEYLKVDGIFVRNILSDRTDMAMVKAITDVGQTMGKRIIAEFVESDDVATHLKRMGLDFGQGFGIHKPERWENLF
ncbi:putative bifunctional diguanylate cyclase/phosphodiesterase [Natronospira bacteriovora]|uniref:EAL domain-containing protein n=1 Tax=Natronospira bacteriovora TaxID=3069753 RepID=A0ABU0W6Z6_9GAMM|nr:EAL domain-containing protein [Natronospira sp. AB-CW4]MDQ2069792.1 EAL domain-containing protein [Natronospira sp. AB-CW4]